MRIRALDIGRGLILLFAVVVVSPIDNLPFWWGHAEWQGIYLIDYSFPTFVFLSGCGMTFLYRKEVPIRATVRRFVVLLVAGLIYNGILGHSQLVNWRIPGVLQAYAVMTVVFFFLHKFLRSIRAWMIASAVAVLGHTLALWTFMFRCPGHELTAACNPSRTIDFRLFGPAHLYGGGQFGYDPEGLVSVAGVIVTGMFGATSGHLILSLWKGKSTWRSVWIWYGLALGLLAVTWPLVPAIKILWTGSFAALMAVVNIPVIFALFYLFDQRPWTRTKEIFTYPLVAMGRNPLLIYFGRHFFNGLLMMSGADHDLRIDVGTFFFPWDYNFGILWFNVVLWIGLAIILHRHKVYIHA